MARLRFPQFISLEDFPMSLAWTEHESVEAHPPFTEPNTIDDLFVTGHLGGSLGGKHLRFVPRIQESRWLTKNFSVHAMIDLSDGLGADLLRLGRASKLGFEIEVQKLPLARGATIDNAFSDGEDYELLFAISPRERDRLQRQWKRKFSKLPLTRIGRLSQLPALNSRPLPSGYVHFK